MATVVEKVGVVAANQAAAIPPKREPLDAKAQSLRVIPLEKLRESKTNPRRIFDSEAMENLVYSVQQKGILIPLIVRPVNGHYEIVAGARRYRAALKANLKEVPVLVREFSDDQAIEAQLMENMDRKNLHPLEEGECYRGLIATKKWTPQSIATRVGKSLRYVYSKLELASLIEPAKKSFTEGFIDEGHATEIARLSPGDQTTAFEQLHASDGQGKEKVFYTMTVRDLKGWIAREIYLKLPSAPWKKDDPNLVKAAGPCSTCPKRAGNSPDRFPEVKDPNTCTDRACFEGKMAAWLQVKKSELEATGAKVKLISPEYNSKLKGATGRSGYHQVESGAKPCGKTCTGLYAEGGAIGKTIQVCLAGGYGVCKEPGHGYKSMRSTGSPRRSSGAAKPSEAERARAKEEERRREAGIVKSKATERARLEILGQVLRKTSSISRAELEMLAEASQGLPYLDEKDPDWLPPDLDTPAKISKASDKDLAKFLVVGVLSDDLGSYGDARLLYAAAKRHKVKVDEIEKAAVKAVVDERAHHDRRQAWKGRVAAQARSYKILTCKGCGRTQAEQAKGGWHWADKNDKSKVGLCSTCEGLDK